MRYTPPKAVLLATEGVEVFGKTRIFLGNPHTSIERSHIFFKMLSWKKI
jgi:hypothetical protein